MRSRRGGQRRRRAARGDAVGAPGVAADRRRAGRARALRPARRSAVGQRRARPGRRREGLDRHAASGSGALRCAPSRRSTRGPDIGGGPSPVIITQRKVLPEWSVRLLVAALLLAPRAGRDRRVRAAAPPARAGCARHRLDAGLGTAVRDRAGVRDRALADGAARRPRRRRRCRKDAIPFDGSAKVALLSVVLVVRPVLARRAPVRRRGCRASTARRRRPGPRVRWCSSSPRSPWSRGS